MEYVSSDRKLLPYGMMNFEDIRLDNYYYVDKTSFIPFDRTIRPFFLLYPPTSIWKKPDFEYAATLL